MIRLLGSRGASAVMGFFMLALASSEAPAQAVSTGVADSVQIAPFDVKAAVKEALPAPATESAYRTATAAPSGTPLKSATVTALYATRPAPSVTVALPSVTVALPSVTVALPSVTPPATSSAVLANGTRIAAVPAAAASQAAPAIAREAAWLYRNGWPLYALVDRYGAGAPLDEQANCIAVAIYHEARGEALDGQLAVARVIMNRAASGRYPGSWCGTVKQPWQFSFVNPRTGQMPGVNEVSASWRKAQAITRLAISNAVPSLSNDVLWYHADYVAPSWGRRLSFVQKIGTHIFYRS
ncbi:MAG: cell wall hydrolase [Sphingomicrobium sp.]